MNYRKAFITTLVPLFALSQSLIASAGANSEKVSSQNTITLSKAIQVASAGTSGVVTSTQLDSIDKTPVYIIQLESGKETYEYVIDGVTGKIMETTHRTFHVPVDNGFIENFPETKISLLEAVAIVTEQYEGEVTSTSIDLFDEVPIYFITQESDILMSERIINALTGEMMAEINIKATSPELMEYMADDFFNQESLENEVFEEIKLMDDYR